MDTYACKADAIYGPDPATYTFRNVAEAYGDDNPLWADPDYARTTRWSGPMYQRARYTASNGRLVPLDRGALERLAGVVAGSAERRNQPGAGGESAAELVQEFLEAARRFDVVGLQRETGDALTLTVAPEDGRALPFRQPDIDLLRDLADVTARSVQNIWLYHAAELANRAKEEFLATLSHELRTPLTPVLIASSALRDDASPCPPASARCGRTPPAFASRAARTATAPWPTWAGW
mgnify:CR=1 FL=1